MDKKSSVISFSNGEVISLVSNGNQYYLSYRDCDSNLNIIQSYSFLPGEFLFLKERLGYILIWRKLASVDMEVLEDFVSLNSIMEKKSQKEKLKIMER